MGWSGIHPSMSRIDARRRLGEVLGEVKCGLCFAFLRLLLGGDIDLDGYTRGGHRCHNGHHWTAQELRDLIEEGKRRT